MFNEQQQPLGERLYFQAPRAPLAVTARADKAQYTIRDKVSVQLSTATTDARPAGASL
ncbi:hypothetical protein [Hymenobacter algoricola]|uniref:Uncharacterized protein n=1 Tax=Hymenobacter algoricola TaxID=486267 RepID=A0ABP7NH06_9BACT